MKIEDMKRKIQNQKEDNQTKFTVPRGWLGGGPAMQCHIFAMVLAITLYSLQGANTLQTLFQLTLWTIFYFFCPIQIQYIIFVVEINIETVFKPLPRASTYVSVTHKSLSLYTMPRNRNVFWCHVAESRDIQDYGELIKFINS